MKDIETRVGVNRLSAYLWKERLMRDLKNWADVGLEVAADANGIEARGRDIVSGPASLTGRGRAGAAILDEFCLGLDPSCEAVTIELSELSYGIFQEILEVARALNADGPVEMSCSSLEAARGEIAVTGFALTLRGELIAEIRRFVNPLCRAFLD